MKPNNNYIFVGDANIEKTSEPKQTMKCRIENIKETSQNIFAAAYQLRKNLFGEDELEKTEILPAKCMLDDLEQIYTFLSETYSIIQGVNEKII